MARGTTAHAVHDVALADSRTGPLPFWFHPDEACSAPALALSGAQSLERRLSVVARLHEAVVHHTIDYILYPKSCVSHTAHCSLLGPNLARKLCGTKREMEVLQVDHTCACARAIHACKGYSSRFDLQLQTTYLACKCP